MFPFFKITLIILLYFSIIRTWKIRPNKYLEVMIYSGRQNPIFSISGPVLKKFYELKVKNVYSNQGSYRLFGYRGMYIYDRKWKREEIIYCQPKLEKYLLSLMIKRLSKAIVIYILKEISICGKKIKKVLKHRDHVRGLDSDWLMSTPLKVSKRFSPNMTNIWNNFTMINITCNNTPMNGGDLGTDYNPLTDNDGCFIKKKFENNCYNYATNIVTNTFAQPGRDKGKIFSNYTCNDVIKASIIDGLKYLGFNSPDLRSNKSGHFLALVMFIGIDFHWYRLDRNGMWSHKPGTTNVTNVDGSGNLIFNPNPSFQNSLPYTVFCGYFHVIPSKITIK